MPCQGAHPGRCFGVARRQNCCHGSHCTALPLFMLVQAANAAQPVLHSSIPSACAQILRHMQARRINVAERARADGELAWQQPVHDERMQLFSVEPRATCALSSRYCGMCTFALVNLHASSRQTETGSRTAVKAAATAAPLRVCLAKELLRGTADAAWWAVRLHRAPNAMRSAARCRARQLGVPRRQPAHMLRAPRSRVQTAALAIQ